MLVRGHSTKEMARQGGRTAEIRGEEVRFAPDSPPEGQEIRTLDPLFAKGDFRFREGGSGSRRRQEAISR